MSGIDTAASAFETEINAERGVQTRSSDGEGKEMSTMAVDELFPFMNTHEDDVIAGGDADEDKRAARSVEGNTDVEDDPDPEKVDSDPDADEDENPDPDADEDENPDPDEDEDQDDSPVYEVMVDGEKTEVSLNEALTGYIRQETFHRRLNKLNEFEKEVTNFGKTLVDDHNKYVGLIEEVEAAYEALMPPEPDWDAMYQQDPAKARRLEKDFKAARGKLEEVRTKKAEAIKEHEERQAAEIRRWQQGENAKLSSLFPAWTDPAKGKEIMKRDVEAMRQTALSAGFSDDEINSTYDSRMLVILNKAAAYDRMMSKRAPVPVKRGKTPVTHGAGRNRTAPKGGTRDMKQLSRTGSVHDAVAVFDNIIKSQRPKR